MRPHPPARRALPPLLLGLALAACSRPHPATAPPAGALASTGLQAAILAAARTRVPAITACSIGWVRPVSATEAAVVFTCTGCGGPFQGTSYNSAPDQVDEVTVAPLDRRAAFTHQELSGQRVGTGGQYEIVSGVVNRRTIDAMTVAYADGILGMMQVGDG